MTNKNNNNCRHSKIDIHGDNGASRTTSRAWRAHGRATQGEAAHVLIKCKTINKFNNVGRHCKTDIHGDNGASKRVVGLACTRASNERRSGPCCRFLLIRATAAAVPLLARSCRRTTTTVGRSSNYRGNEVKV